MKGDVIDDVALRMADGDTVATALADVDEGRRLTEADPVVTLAEAVPFGHKVALVAHDTGDPVRKYGEVIGEATERIERGEWVHTHNCASRRGRGDRAVAEVNES